MLYKKFMRLLVIVPSSLFVTSTYAIASPIDEAVSVDFSRYEVTYSASVPKQFVFTNGANKPAFEPMSNSIIYVADIDNDNCDDVLLDFADSAAEPRVFFGNPEKEFVASDPFIGKNPVRHIRRAAFADLNDDGINDIIGFTAPHGWRSKDLGEAWDGDEPEFIALSETARRFRVLQNDYQTYAHAGVVADLDHDGTLDILPIWETYKSPFWKGGKTSLGLKISLSDMVEKTGIRLKNQKKIAILDATAGDLNGDGLADLVLATGDYRYDNKKSFSPKMATKLGTVAVYFGERGRDIQDVKPIRMGTHWMPDAIWENYIKRTTINQKNKFDGLAAPSNVNLLDIDDDGDLDIVVGYFVSNQSSWETSSFEILENISGKFVPATDKFVPYQPANRDHKNRTGFIESISLADIDQDGRKDLLLTMRVDEKRSRHDELASIFINRDGKFLPVSKEKSSGWMMINGPKTLRPGDFNCDGKPDLVGVQFNPKNPERETVVAYFFAKSREDSQASNELYLRHNIDHTDRTIYKLNEPLSYAIESLSGTEKPSRHIGKEPVFRISAQISNNLTGEQEKSGRVEMQLFVRLKEDTADSEKEIERLLLFRNPKGLFGIDKSSQDNWKQISTNCDVDEKYIEIPLIDLFGTRTNEFQCILENLEAPMLSSFIQVMMHVGSSLELNLD